MIDNTIVLRSVRPVLHEFTLGIPSTKDNVSNICCKTFLRGNLWVVIQTGHSNGSFKRVDKTFHYCYTLWYNSV